MIEEGCYCQSDYYCCHDDDGCCSCCKLCPDCGECLQDCSCWKKDIVELYITDEDEDEEQ